MQQQPNNLFLMCPRPCAQGEFIFVKGEQMARDYPTAYGATMRFIDTDDDYMYVKKAGYTPSDYEFRRIKLLPEPIPEQPQMHMPFDISQFVTREQFDSLNTKIDSLVNALNDKRDNFNRKNRDRDRNKEVVIDAE